jgi:glycosyltransferase involved in cell wall biosynthesis
MKVCHISKFDLSGGAARSAWRLHGGLRGIGVDSRMLVLLKRSHDSNVFRHVSPANLFTRKFRAAGQRLVDRQKERWMRAVSPLSECFSGDRNPRGMTMELSLRSDDIVNLHWVADLLDYASFFPAVATERPIVWTLHDMNPFTGGCHYDNECGRHIDQCGACPALGSELVNDPSRRIWNRKAKVFRQLPADRLHIVAPSSWLRREAQNSSLFKPFRTHHIPYGIDTEEFAPRDQHFSRELLGLPKDSRIVLFIAANLTNQRKGAHLLFEALSRLASIENLLLVSLGSNSNTLNTHLPIAHLGNISDDRLLSAAYSAANVMAIPSLQDNLPNTVLESMACGTPVVGFDTGGIPDMVRPRETGWLAPVANSERFAEHIREALENRTLRDRLSKNCRRVALQEYTLSIQATRYMNLYRDLSNAKTSRD